MTLFLLYVIMVVAVFLATAVVFGREEYHNCLTFSVIWIVSIPWFIYEVYKVFRFNYKMTRGKR